MKEKIRLLFVSSRPLSWVNTAFPFGAGYLYSAQSVDSVFIIGSLFFLVPYNLLMYGINDVYDYESDVTNPRKGGVEGAVVAKKYHRFLLAWSYGLPLPFVLYLLSVGSMTAGLVLLGVLFFVVAYSAKGLRFKEIPVLDSITSSLHFVGPLVFALSLTGWPTAAWYAVGGFFLWGIASHSLGAVQDIIADRAAGIHSIATVLGARTTIVFSLLHYVAAIVLVVQIGVMGALVGGALVTYVINVLPYLRITDATSGLARTAWRRFLWINYLVGAVVTITLLASTAAP